MRNKQIYKFLPSFILVLLFVTNTMSQEQVVLNNNEFGQGILRSKKGKCYIITPKHVIEGYAGDLKAIGHYGVFGNSVSEKKYPFDLAILKVLNGDLRCEEWLKMSNFDVMLNTQYEGHLSIREEDGSLTKFPVDIVSHDAERILIKPKDKNRCIVKGMSGSSLLINGAVAGMLLSVNNSTCAGTILRKDYIMNLTESFFEVKETEADKSLAELNKIADDVVNSFKFKGSYVTITKRKLEGYFDLVDKIFIGESIDKLTTSIDVKLLKGNDLEDYGMIPFFPGAKNVFIQCQFLDGTFSEIKERKIVIEPNARFQNYYSNELKLIKSPKGLKPNPVYLSFSEIYGHGNLFILPVTPLNTETVLYSYDTNGFFEISKKNHSSSVFYGVYTIDIPINSSFIKLKYRLENGEEVGPFEYELDGLVNLVKEAYKNTISKQLTNTFACHKIPASPVIKKSDDTPETGKEMRERIQSLSKSAGWGSHISSTLQIRNTKILETYPRILCAPFWGDSKVVNANSFIAVKQVRFGLNSQQLDKIIPVDLDIKKMLEKDMTYKHKLNETLFASFPINSNVFYVQLTYYDNTKSRIVRMPLKDLFKFYFQD